MKKYLLIIILVFALGLPGCSKAQKEKELTITPAPEVVEIQEKQNKKSSMIREFPYDNETPAEQADFARLPEGVVSPICNISSREYLFAGKKKWNGSQVTAEEAQRNHLLIRYNHGSYYSINPARNGGYLLLLFGGGAGDTLYQKAGCRITKLVDIETFDRKIKVGAPAERIKELCPDAAVFGSEDFYADYVCWTSDLTERIVRVDNQGGKTVIKNIYTNYDSVLTYLLPQDLALIS